MKKKTKAQKLHDELLLQVAQDKRDFMSATTKALIDSFRERFEAAMTLK